MVLWFYNSGFFPVSQVIYCPCEATLTCTGSLAIDFSFAVSGVSNPTNVGLSLKGISSNISGFFGILPPGSAGTSCASYADCISFSNGTIPGSVSVFGVTDTAMNVWGAGITQNVDAAATELYLDWRHFNADVTCSAAMPNCQGAAAVIGTVRLEKLQTEGFDAIIGGARVKF